MASRRRCRPTRLACPLLACPGPPLYSGGRMLAIASRRVSRARRLAHLFGHNPEYVLGRFATVRDAYSVLNSLRDAVASGAPLRIGDLYEEPTVALAVA